MESPPAVAHSISDKRQLVDNVVSFFLNSNTWIGACISSEIPAMTAEYESITKARMEAIKKGVKIRYIIDITRENLQVCKNLLSLVSEVRHLHGIKGSFGVSDSEFVYANVAGHDKSDDDRFIYSKSKTIIQLHSQLFELLWEKAMPSDQRLKELEEGVRLQKTEVIPFGQDSLARNNEVYARTQQKMDVCADQHVLKFVIGFYPLYSAYLDLKKRGVRIRFIAEVTSDSLVYCKELLKIVDELRHADSVTGSFAISDGAEYLATPVLEPSALLTPQLIYSNVTGFVRQNQYLFETLWNNAIPAGKRIEEIESGKEKDFFNLLVDASKTSHAYLESAGSIEKEALLLLSDNKALARDYQLGVIDLLINASRDKHAEVKIICPLDESNSHIVKEISQKAPDIRIMNGENSSSTVFIADDRRFFRVEISHPELETFESAVGYAVYANTKPSIDLFRKLFRLQWHSLLLIERMKTEDKVKEDFINIAAHELRSPMHPIMIYAKMLRDNGVDANEAADVILEQAKKFNRLAEGILTVSRIEGNSLYFNKEAVNLRNLLSDYLQSSMNSSAKATILELYEDNKVENIEEGKNHGNNDDDNNNNNSNEIITVFADATKIIQVLDNLISNATKFAKGGEIRVAFATRINKELQRKEAIISISDNGPGIDADIFPRLFTKFATKSSSGLGLGLFVCKKIIEGHGGKIWAENNKPGKGATFHFTLLIENSSLGKDNSI